MAKSQVQGPYEHDSRKKMSKQRHNRFEGKRGKDADGERLMVTSYQNPQVKAGGRTDARSCRGSEDRGLGLCSRPR